LDKYFICHYCSVCDSQFYNAVLQCKG